MRYTITAALPYTNGPIHIGHLAGVYIPADIFSRYLRQNGHQVAYICGSDEHGVAISMKARKENSTPKEVIDKYHFLIKKAFEDFGISFDTYGRTSDKIHYETVSDFFLDLQKKGIFQEEEIEQLYDPEAKQFLADRFVSGTCPKCNSPEAYGDQCENCGSSLNATDLINPKSAISGAEPILKKTKHWFLPLNNYSDFIKKWILDGHKSDWKSNVYGQVKSWLEDGLRPRAVTRDLDWGIPVPIKGAEGKVLYVWFDAPLGYISFTKQWAGCNDTSWKPHWKDKDTQLIHFIGKDNIVFHCIIFPAMLKAQGDYILPKNVPANEFLNLEGKKISTSKNWAVWLHEYLEDFPNKQDVLRYVLTSIMPESKDSDFTWKDFQSKNNNELVAVFGNFFNRITVLTHKYHQGAVPSPKDLDEQDNEVLRMMESFPKRISKYLDSYQFREATQEMMRIARLGNKYLADKEPWKLIKTHPERVETIMYVALQLAASLAVLSAPFLPMTSIKMLDILDMKKDIHWDETATRELLPPKSLIRETSLLFDKIEDKMISEQIEKLEKTKTSQETLPKNLSPYKKSLVDFDTFNTLDIRVGTIISAKKISNSDKLLVLKIDTGIDQRTIVSGISEHYNPESLISQKICFLANLKPRKFRGVESQGMILTTQREDGKIDFVLPSDESVINGKEIK